MRLPRQRGTKLTPSRCCCGRNGSPAISDRKSTRLNSSHTEIYTLSLHDALPILVPEDWPLRHALAPAKGDEAHAVAVLLRTQRQPGHFRSEEHTSELQSHRDLHSFPTRRSSDLSARRLAAPPCACPGKGGRSSRRRGAVADATAARPF